MNILFMVLIGFGISCLLWELIAIWYAIKELIIMQKINNQILNTAIRLKRIQLIAEGKI